MNTRLRHANSIEGKLLQAPANALLLMLALGTAAPLHAQSGNNKPQAGTYSLLYSFQCSPDGRYPQSALVRDFSGNLYGTTHFGGEYDYGTVFKLTSNGTETVLHSLAGPPSDGGYPTYGKLTLDEAGNLYGTTPYFGELHRGTVFKVTATGAESVLYNFTGGSDGSEPNGGVVRDNSGNLYGTTAYGGTSGVGVVFKLTPSGAESVLHDFSTDGEFPSGNITRDSLGNLYGTAYDGGAFFVGSMFEVTASGAESLLYSFRGFPVDGAKPEGGGLLRDASGNLYGVSSSGGANNHGVVFMLTSTGAESVLLNFNGGTGGGYPVDGLTRDASGNLYGTTNRGGSGTGCGAYGCGVLFALTTDGREIVLHDFTLGSSADGAIPYDGVLRDPSGNLYGTLYFGGAYGCGAVFKYTP